MAAFYNEIDPYAAQWLRNLIAAGHIAHGVVDERSIVDITPADVAGFTQVHFFAGIGGWSLAARLAGWPDDRPLWTGSCPCQPFSVAGAGAGQADARHLWPEMFRLVSELRPDVVMGEQVAAAVGKSWLDGVHSDLESIGYSCGAAVVPACAVDAPHRRDRLWFVADQSGRRCEVAPLQPRIGGAPGEQRQADIAGVLGALSHGGRDSMANASRLCGQVHPDAGGRTPRSGSGEFAGLGSLGNGDVAAADQSSARQEWQQRSGQLGGAGSNPWRGAQLAIGADGKARRVKPGVRLLAHGIPARVGKLRALGNAIVPQVAAEVIGAYLDCAADA